MATKTITAMFTTRADAERAASDLVSQLGVSQSSVRVSPGASTVDTGYDASQPYKETGFFASLKELFVPDEDRYAYAEGMRRGSVLLNASVEEGKLEQAADVLERAGALDLDAQEESWRQTGWTGYDAAAHGAVAAAAVSTPVVGSAVGTKPAHEADTIKIVQERLVVGKRAAETGRVKVRSYVVERPVEETVSLHEETVHVTRHAVDRPATAADLANAFGERTIEAHAVSEEAVVAKEVRVVEEIAVYKEATDRVETVHDTVRETKVEVDDTTATVHPGASHLASVAGGATGVVAAADRALNTNASETNPAADAPDGTAGNPPGTMASRAVDKTLGTNLSGANPTGKL